MLNTRGAQELFGRCVFNLDGHDHLRARRLLREPLTRRGIDRYASRLAVVADRHMRRWARAPVLDLYQAIRAMTLAMSLEVLLGVETWSRLSQHCANLLAQHKHKDLVVRLAENPVTSAYQYFTSAHMARLNRALPSRTQLCPENLRHRIFELFNTFV